MEAALARRGGDAEERINLIADNSSFERFEDEMLKAGFLRVGGRECSGPSNSEDPSEAEDGGVEVSK